MKRILKLSVTLVLVLTCAVFMSQAAFAQSQDDVGTIIRIESAKYGNLDYDFGNAMGYKEHFCDAKPALQKICDGKRNCKVTVGNKICGDPWPGHGKFLYVEYSCGGKIKRVKRVQTEIVKLSCP